MLKRENRLVPGVRFGNSYVFSTPEFVLKEKKNGLSLNRFGIIVSKKIDKRAVVRNRVKRIFRHTLEELNKSMTPGHDMLFITGIAVLNKTKEESYTIIRGVLEKLGFIKNKK